MKSLFRGLTAAAVASVTALSLMAISSPATRADNGLAPGTTTTSAPKHVPNPNEHHGKVTAVSATSITIHNKKAGDETFTVTSSTKVKVDKVKSTIADVTVGMHASVLSKDGTTADKIHAHVATPHVKKS